MARDVQIARSGRHNREFKKTERKLRQRTAAKRLAILCVILLAMLGIAAYVLVFRSHDVALIKEFDKTDGTFGLQKVSLENSLAPSAASELCVATEDVPMEGLDLTADAAAIFSEATQEVPYAKNIHKKMYPASITKVMTCLVALKYGNLNDMVTVGEECKDIETGSSVCEIHVGDQLTLRQLLYGLMINSGNDAAMTIAVHVGQTTDRFIEMMNQEALEIGATNTHFMNPHGLQDENHYTSVYDVYLMFREALKYQEFQDIISKATYYATYTNAVGEETGIMWESTNHYFINEAIPPANTSVIGGKTGTTSEAGACLCLYSKDKYGDPYITIILNASTKEVLYNEMNELLSKINK